jgi:hypothetical protein
MWNELARSAENLCKPAGVRMQQRSGTHCNTVPSTDVNAERQGVSRSFTSAVQGSEAPYKKFWVLRLCIKVQGSEALYKSSGF